MRLMDRDPFRRALGQPLHPLLVHFPIALWGMSFVFDLLSFQLGPALVEAARYNVLGGILSALIAGTAGVHDYRRRLRPGSPARRIGRYHVALNALAFGLFVVSLALRWHVRGAPQTPRAPFVLSAIGVAVLGVAGYLGGVMVFNLRPRDVDRQLAVSGRIDDAG